MEGKLKINTYLGGKMSRVIAHNRDDVRKSNISIIHIWSMYKYYIVLFISQLILLILNVIYVDSPFLLLNENQILYTYSTSAQVIAGLYGLTLTGYIFYNDKLSKLFQEDESLYDVVERLKTQNYIHIVFLGVGCLLSIGLSLFVLNTQEFLNSSGFSFLLNETMIIVVTEIILIIIFSCSMANPNSIEKANKQLLEESDYKKADSEKGSLEDFLTNYNAIEKNIFKLGEKFYYHTALYQDYYQKNKNRPGILSYLKLLLSQEVLDQELFYNINELRKYRNSTVHSDYPNVSAEAVKNAILVNEKLIKKIKKHGIE